MSQLLIGLPPAMAISNDERDFFISFGERLAQLRRAKGLTQVQLADLLAVSQQAVTAYESGQRRVPISTLALLARTLSITVEELIGAPAKRSNSKRGPAPKLQQQIVQLSRLPKDKQRLASQLIESVIAQADR